MKFEPDRGNYFFNCCADFFIVTAFAHYPDRGLVSDYPAGVLKSQDRGVNPAQREGGLKKV